LSFSGDGEDGEMLDTSSGADSGKDPGIYSPPNSYIDRFCIPTTDSSTELCFAGECMLSKDDCQCVLYTQEASTGHVIGVCDVCGVCGDGSFKADCVNVGLYSIDCSNDQNESLQDEKTTETASTQLTTNNPSSGGGADIDTTTPHDKPSSESDGEFSSVNTPSTAAVSYSESDYSCAGFSNGFELCQAKSCDVSAMLQHTLVHKPLPHS
jgi:hypothetical protein